MKFKRIKSAKQGKTFKKGEQCVQNPSTRKHRDNVKKSVMSHNKTGGGLTVEALEKHEEAMDDEISLTGLTISDKSSAVSAKSKAFSISGLTDCSNLSFYNVLNKWSSTNALDQEKCAILAAVTEVIRSKGGTENETEYFAALMTALDGNEENGANFITAITFLISLVIKKVPPEVLKAKFSDTCKSFVVLLQKYYEDGRASLLMALLQCLSTSLMAQEVAVWSESSTQHTFQILLTFVVHSKPKVRKLAQASVQSLLKLNLINHKKHPIGSATTKFAIQMLQQHGKDTSSTAHHVLNMLKQCLHYLNAQNLKELCETILSLLSSNDHIIKTNTMSTLSAMFNANPPEENLNVELNMKLIAVLYDFQPNVNDISVATSWLSLMLASHSNLSLISDKSCIKILPLFYERAMKFLLSENRTVALAAADNMKKVSGQCLEPSLELVEEDIKAEDSSFLKIFQHIEAGLGYKYAPVWDIVLNALQYMYLAFGKISNATFKSNVINLIDLHGTPDFPFINSLEKTVGAAVKSLGPEFILNERPLNLVSEEKVGQFPNAWLLPVMKDHIEATSLQYFISHFLPMAAQIRQKAMKCREINQDLEAKVLETLLSQIWSLLPGFCTNPVDLKEAFPNIAKILGTAMNDRKDLRAFVLQALRTLISKTIDEDELKCIGNFSKNYLPILFNLYTSEDKDCAALSLPILETIKVFLVITDTTLISTFLKRLLEKLKTETVTNKQLQLMDLAVCMVRYSSEDLTENLYKIALDHIKDQDKGKQKKSYRILEELLDSNSESCKELVKQKFKKMQKVFTGSQDAAAPSSKAPRLRCLSLMVKKLDDGSKDFLNTILPEVILCTKGISVKARDAAFDLLVDIGSAFVYLSKQSKEECIEKYFQFVMAGLAGSPHMISASLLTFTKLVHEYRHCITATLISSVLENAVELLKSKNTEVVKACLLFVRAITKILDANELSGHLEVMIKNLFCWNISNRNTYRTQIKHIIEKLERKCGYELIKSYIPDAHKKLLVHMRKMRERGKRNKDKVKPDDDMDKEDRPKDTWEDILAESDDENEAPKGKSNNTRNNNTKDRSSNKKTWIVEGDDAVDLLDPSAAKKVVATRPKKMKKERKSDDFDFSSDGRLLINDDEDDKDNDQSMEGPLDIGEKDMLGGFDKTPKKLKLGKRKHLEEMPEDDEMNMYQPGGSGIHRKQDDEPSNKKKFGEEYRAKKSDGDVRLKGKHDPYAYIPLDRQKLNKRKQAKLSGQFNGMVKAARKGAQVGSNKFRKNKSK